MLSKTARFGDGTQGPGIPYSLTFEPEENLKSAYGFIEHPPTVGDVGPVILSTLRGLPTEKYMAPASPGIPYHLPWNSEVLAGMILPYKKENTNIAYTGPPYPESAGKAFGLFSACPVASIPFAGKFLAPDLNYKNALNVNSSALEEGIYQALNFYLRGRADLAMQNLNHVARLATRSPDGAVLLGGNGRALASFIMASNILEITTFDFPKGIDLVELETTLAKLQQAAGWIPDGYSSFDSSTFTGDPVESTNSAVLAYCPKLAEQFRTVHASGEYNLTSVPDAVL